jgi:hypothetical protein
MLPSELLANARKRLFDTIGKDSKKYWSDYELLVEYGNLALDKMFLGVRRLIIDSITASDLQGKPLCSVPLVAGTAAYAISPKIIEISAATVTEITDPVLLTTQLSVIKTKTVAEMDAEYCDWRNNTTGWPSCIITDLNTDSVTVWPTPVAYETPPPATLTPTVSFTVHRFPLRRLSLLASGAADDTVAFGFREEYQEYLIYGILAEAYMKDDGEVKRLDLAGINEKKFDAKIESIRDDLSRRLRVNRGVRTKLAYR